MKTKKRDYVQELFKLLMVLGLIALLFAPGAAVQARTPKQVSNITAPLAPQLTWNDLGLAERTFPVNGESVTLTGTVYGAGEEFNYETNDAVAAYYTPLSLALIGWQEVGNLPQSNGMSTLYFKDGVFSLVEFAGCEDNAALACLTVWESAATTLAPTPYTQDSPAPLAAAAFNKTSPLSGAFNMSSPVTLKWNAYSGTKFNHYRICIDTIDNDLCDNGANGWTSIWGGTAVTSVTVGSLAPATKYFWQIQAVLTDGTKVDSNAGDDPLWWHFKTMGALPYKIYLPLVKR